MKRSWATTAGTWALLAQVGQVMAGTGCIAGGESDWYTNSVGETPCATYQRLRQQCDPTYQVGQFKKSSPGDTCSGASSACCCNSIAWNLSMLCFNCQNNNLSYGSGSQDAPAGAFGVYQAGCSPVTTGALPAPVQVDTCNANLDLRTWLYPLDWSDGSWFYGFYSTSTQNRTDFNTRNLTNCPSILAAASSTSKSASHTSTPIGGSTGSPNPSASKSAPIGAIVGGVIGGLALILAGVIAFFCLRHQRDKKPQMSTTDNQSLYNPYPTSVMASYHTGAYPQQASYHSNGPSNGVSYNSLGYVVDPFQQQPVSPTTHRSTSRGPLSEAGSSDPGFAGLGAGIPSPNNTNSSAMGTSGTTDAAENMSFVRLEPNRKSDAFRGAVTRPVSGFESELPYVGGSSTTGAVVGERQRHQDAGVSLQRSGSGRLPPSYPGR